MLEIVKEQKTKIHFPHGLYGFESYYDFELFPAEIEPLLRLDADSNNDLSFLLVDPFVFFPDYEIDVDDDTVALLEIDNPEDVYVLTIITIAKTKPAVVTANLQGPVVINRKNKHARQVVLLDPRWKTKHNLFDENTSE